jgi:hypothetical protein
VWHSGDQKGTETSPSDMAGTLSSEELESLETKESG